jgi:predicted dinucleotide-binding enzyme
MGFTDAIAAAEARESAAGAEPIVLQEGDGMDAQRSPTGRVDTVGIIGAGRLGQALAHTALRARRQVVIANSHGPESLAPLVAALGAGVSPGTVTDVAACAMVFLAVPWASVPTAVAGVEWAGEIVVDATNALLFPSLEPAPLGGRTSSEIVAELVSGAWLVKAGNTLSAEVLGADPDDDGGRRVIFVSGDHDEAKKVVVDYFDNAGFSAIDLGDLVTGGYMQQVGGPLAGQNLVRLP